MKPLDGNDYIYNNKIIHYIGENNKRGTVLSELVFLCHVPRKFGKKVSHMILEQFNVQ